MQQSLAVYISRVLGRPGLKGSRALAVTHKIEGAVISKEQHVLGIPSAVYEGHRLIDVCHLLGGSPPSFLSGFKDSQELSSGIHVIEPPLPLKEFISVYSVGNRDNCRVSTAGSVV